MTTIHIPNKINRVYVAGAYSADNVITVLDNIREGMRLATEVFLAGFSPFCPWLDFHFQLMLRENERLTVEDYYIYSLAWLDVSDAMLVGTWRGWDKSKGLRAEIERAYHIGIPVFYKIESLIDIKREGG
jgi:hypothetical protein